MNDTEAIARAIITQMSREDREDFTPSGWRDGVSAMLANGWLWERPDLEEVLSAIDAALTESRSQPHVRLSATKGRAWNHAAAFNVAARAELERRECLANPDRPRKRAWSTAAVARALGVPSTQWHNWVVGRQSPSTARLVEWLRAWEGAGLPPLTVTTTAMGVEVTT